MNLFKERIGDLSAQVWKSAAEELEFSRITGFSEDEICFLTFSAGEIKKRQELFHDVTSNPGLAERLSEVVTLVNDLEEVRRRAVVYPSKSAEQTLYTIRSFSLLFAAADVISSIDREYSGRIKSERLTAFFEDAEKFGREEGFEQDREYVESTASGAEYTKSMTLCVNLDAKLEPYEVGVISVHDKPFVSTSVFTGLLGDRSASQIKHISPLVPISSSAAVKDAVYQYLNNGVSKSLRKKAESMTPRMSRYIEYFSGIKEEFSFILHALRFLDDLKPYAKALCYPGVSEDFSTTELYSEKLCVAHRGDVVPNDVKRIGERKMYLLTGANNGGKSVFINMVGVTQLLFQLGLPVPARTSEMRIFKKIFCHFPNVTADRDSRFADECRRMKNITGGMDGETLILMDESFSSTGDDEGAEVALGVLRKIENAGAVCFFSTHLHALGNLVKDGTLGMEPMAIAMDGDEPTYRVVYGRLDDYSHAMRIAEQFGLV